MNKYRLKKELPFAKVGDEVSISGYNGNIIVKNDLGETWIGYQAALPKLMIDGWIEEEAKPREFIVELYGGNYQFGRIVDEAGVDCKPYKYIKVREVL